MAATVAAEVRGEEQSRAGEFNGIRQASQGRHRCDLLSGFDRAFSGQEQVFEHGRIDRAKAQHVGSLWLRPPSSRRRRRT